MEVRDFIRLGQQPPALRFLIIGGYGVAAHGFTRATFDVDFLVRREDGQAWETRLVAAKLTKCAATETFAQFAQPGGGDGLDLMLVNNKTFLEMWNSARDWEFGEVEAKVPCLDHLLSLKLHALKQGLAHRTTKDAEDVVQLARHNKLDLLSPYYERLFLKYANREIYETILRTLKP